MDFRKTEKVLIGDMLLGLYQDPVANALLRLNLRFDRLTPAFLGCGHRQYRCIV